MESIYQKIIDQVLTKNHLETLNVSVFESGQIHKVININDQYVLKIEGEYDYAKGFFKSQPERMDQLIELGAKVPKIIDFGEFEWKSYLLMNKISGTNLVRDWFKFSDSEKENYLAQVSEQLQIFHNLKSQFYYGTFLNFKDAIVEKTNFNLVNKTKLKPEYLKSLEVMEQCFNTNINLLNEKDTAVFCHNDIHFENIIYENNTITGIIDFDWSIFAPRDYELKKIIDFIHTPENYVRKELEPQYKGYQLIAEFKTLKKFYPALSHIPELPNRIRLYQIIDILWVIKEYQAGTWSEQAMIKTHQKMKDWFQSEWLENVLN